MEACRITAALWKLRSPGRFEREGRQVKVVNGEEHLVRLLLVPLQEQGRARFAEIQLLVGGPEPL
jgi:hypothetical protein